MSFLYQHTVLRLNAGYYILGVTTPKDALIALNSGIESSNAASARVMDVIYDSNPDGSLNLNAPLGFNPLSFEDWIKLPVRDGIDKAIHTSRMTIRCPTVIITNYGEMPMKRFRPTKAVLLQMQGNRCGYTGEILTPKQANIEHVIPKSKGGKDRFENLMAVKKEVNWARGNKPLRETGLKRLFRHKEPKPLPAHYTVSEVKHPDWFVFLK